MALVNDPQKIRSLLVVLRRARLDAGMSLEDLAMKLGRTKGFLSRVESAHRGINLACLPQWVEAVNADSDEVYCAAGIVPPDVAEKLTTNPQLLAEVRELIQ